MQINLFMYLLQVSKKLYNKIWYLIPIFPVFQIMWVFVQIHCITIVFYSVILMYIFFYFSLQIPVQLSCFVLEIKVKNLKLAH